MQYAIEILQREYLNTRYDIRRLRQLSDEVQCDLVKDLPLRETELQLAIAHLQSAGQGESAPTDAQQTNGADGPSAHA